MKVEVAESLIFSWLKHIKGCKITQLNWKSSDNWELFNETEVLDYVVKAENRFPNILKKSKPVQFLSQAEIDVLGIEIKNNENYYYAIDVAFHENGLCYGSIDVCVDKVTQKMIRSAMILFHHFNTKKGEIIFASPKISPKLDKIMKERFQEISEFMRGLGFGFNFTLLSNNSFNEEIISKILAESSKIKDTSELFIRAFQLHNLCIK